MTPSQILYRALFVLFFSMSFLTSCENDDDQGIDQGNNNTGQGVQEGLEDLAAQALAELEAILELQKDSKYSVESIVNASSPYELLDAIDQVDDSELLLTNLPSVETIAELLKNIQPIETAVEIGTLGLVDYDQSIDDFVNNQFIQQLSRYFGTDLQSALNNNDAEKTLEYLQQVYPEYLPTTVNEFESQLELDVASADAVLLAAGKVYFNYANIMAQTQSELFTVNDQEYSILDLFDTVVEYAFNFFVGDAFTNSDVFNPDVSLFDRFLGIFYGGGEAFIVGMIIGVDLTGGIGALPFGIAMGFGAAIGGIVGAIYGALLGIAVGSDEAVRIIREYRDLNFNASSNAVSIE